MARKSGSSTKKNNLGVDLCQHLWYNRKRNRNDAVNINPLIGDQIMERLKLTPKQFAAVEWALGAMPDYWCTESGAWGRGEPTVYSEDEIPYIVDKTLVLSSVAEINEDLRYRLDDEDLIVWGVDLERHESALRPIRRLVKQIKEMEYDIPRI